MGLCELSRPASIECAARELLLWAMAVVTTGSASSLGCVVCVPRLRRKDGGPSRLVPQLCEALARHPLDTKLLTAVHASDAALLPSAPVQVIGAGATRSGRSVRDTVADAVSAGIAGRVVIHDHGLWLPFHYEVAIAARRSATPRVVSPHGTLLPWAFTHKRFKKRIAWLLYQRRILNVATALHATSEREADECRNLGFTQPIAVIPNGVDFPANLPPRRRADAQRIMLFLSRIHPCKGLVNLLHAWAVARPGPEWRLVIAGPDEGGHKSEVMQLTHALGVDRQVEFPGEIADNDKWARYAEADVFVLPSFSENFGLVVAEALASATPAITTTGTPWHELSERRLGWWVHPNAEALAAAIREATCMPRQQLDAMGERASVWARRQFSWQDVAADMVALYRWLIDGGRTPEFVRSLERSVPPTRALEFLHSISKSHTNEMSPHRETKPTPCDPDMRPVQ